MFLLTIAILLHASFALAEGPTADLPILLEGITIVDTAIDEEQEDTEPSHKTVIQSEALQQRFTSVPEILSETVGVKMKRFGGLGDFSSISIRGSSSEQVWVYLDGFLLNAAQGGSVDLGKIPLAYIKSIEIYRGSAPVIFGQSGIGGLVNIRTRSSVHEQILSAQLQYGSFNTSRLNLTFSTKPGKADFLLGINREKSDNDFKFLSDNGTQFEPSDDIRIKRVNSQFESLNLLTKIGYDLTNKQRLLLYYNFLETEKGVPGLGAFQSETANFKTEAHRSSLRFDTTNLFSPGFDTQFELKYALKTEAFQDLEGDIGIGKQDNKNQIQSYEASINTDQVIGNYQIIKTRWQYRRESFKPSDKRSGTKKGRSEREIYTLALEDQVALFDERLFITPGLLYEKIDNRFEGDPGLASLGQEITDIGGKFLSRQIGLLYRITDRLSLSSNIGRYFRQPNLFELFGDRGGSLGNPELLPEKGLNRDIGLSYKRRFKGILRKLEFTATYFDNVAEDLILFIQSSQFTARPENIAKSRVIGQELSAQTDIGKHLSIQGNYTHQRAINQSNIPSEQGKFLPGRPINDFFLKTALNTRFLGLYYSYHLTDQNFLDRRNQRNATSRQIHNIGFSIQSKPLWSLSLEAKNLSDDQIEDIFGFPLPGRSYFITLQGTL